MRVRFKGNQKDTNHLRPYVYTRTCRNNEQITHTHSSICKSKSTHILLKNGQAILSTLFSSCHELGGQNIPCVDVRCRSLDGESQLCPPFLILGPAPLEIELVDIPSNTSNVLNDPNSDVQHSQNLEITCVPRTMRTSTTRKPTGTPQF